jgi:putative nucleotidyltransferase with HDIG domain
MARSAHSRLAVALLAAAPVLLYLLLLPFVSLGAVLPTLHLVAVGGTAVLASLVAVLLTLAALRRNDLRGGLVGAAFTVLAGLLSIHGLATPGFLIDVSVRNATIGLAGVAAVPAAALLLALAVAVPASVPHARRWIVGVEAAVLVALLTFGIVGLVHPQLIPLVPISIKPWMYLVLIPTSAVYALIALRAYRISRMTRRHADAWVAIGVVWLGASLALYLLSSTWALGFWWAHLMEGLGVLVVTFSVAVDLARQRPSQAIARNLRGEDLVGPEEELLGGYVRALTSSLRDLDPSTGAHSRRVATLAVRVGEQLGLDGDVVRRLAIAGLVHDIGKLQLPAEILNKPGRLSDEEFAVIRRHPSLGATLLQRLGGFDEEVSIVAGHHERWDGGGYPAGAAGEEIPFEARILSVCDVYDALTSDRPYRAAWEHERALALLLEERGTAFDAACVDALVGVLGEQASPRVEVVHTRLAPRTAAEGV